MTQEFQIIQEPLNDPDACARGYAIFTVLCVPFLLLPLTNVLLNNGSKGWFLFLMSSVFLCVMFQALVRAHYKTPSAVCVILVGSEYLSIYSGDKRTIYWHQKLSHITDVCIEGDPTDLNEWCSLIIHTEIDSYLIWLGRGAGLGKMGIYRNVRLNDFSAEQFVLKLLEVIKDIQQNRFMD